MSVIHVHLKKQSFLFFSYIISENSQRLHSKHKLSIHEVIKFKEVSAETEMINHTGRFLGINTIQRYNFYQTVQCSSSEKTGIGKKGNKQQNSKVLRKRVIPEIFECHVKSAPM